MTKAFLLGFIAGASKGTREFDNPFSFHDADEEDAAQMWYDKLQWLSDRHKELTGEMLNRGYKPSCTGCLKDEWEGRIGRGYWKGYLPTVEALRINRERIAERSKNI